LRPVRTTGVPVTADNSATAANVLIEVMIVLHLSRANPITLREHVDVGANCRLYECIRTVGCDEL
jgi:hypothetical protein